LTDVFGDAENAEEAPAKKPLNVNLNAVSDGTANTAQSSVKQFMQEVQPRARSLKIAFLLPFLLTFTSKVMFLFFPCCSFFHLIDRWLHLTFFIHFFRWKWQEHCYYRMRENLAEDEILIVTDYSMNFSHAPFNQVNLYLFFIALV